MRSSEGGGATRGDVARWGDGRMCKGACAMQDNVGENPSRVRILFGIDFFLRMPVVLRSSPVLRNHASRATQATPTSTPTVFANPPCPRLYPPLTVPEVSLSSWGSVVILQVLYLRLSIWFTLRSESSLKHLVHENSGSGASRKQRLRWWLCAMRTAPRRVSSSIGKQV